MAKMPYFCAFTYDAGRVYNGSRVAIIGIGDCGLGIGHTIQLCGFGNQVFMFYYIHSGNWLLITGVIGHAFKTHT
jgi:alkyl hydroperoxide reductase subunit AhpF